MAQFMIIRAREVRAFSKERSELKDYLFNLEKLTYGTVDDRQIWFKGLGTYELEEAEWKRVTDSIVMDVD